MRARVWQAVAFLAVVPALCAADPVSENGKERDKLHAELLKALNRINSAPPAVTPMGPTMPPALAPSATNVVPEVALDGTDESKMKAATNYFKVSQFEAARITFNGINTTALPREDRAFVKYMVACCLRRLDRIPEAETAFREVANSDDDEFYKSSAIWQLSLIKSNRDLDTQLRELRSRAKSK